MESLASRCSLWLKQKYQLRRVLKAVITDYNYNGGVTEKTIELCKETLKETL